MWMDPEGAKLSGMSPTRANTTICGIRRTERTDQRNRNGLLDTEQTEGRRAGEGLEGWGGGGEDREARTGTYSAVTGTWSGARGIRSGPLITPDGAGGDEARRGDRALSHVNV